MEAPQWYRARARELCAAAREGTPVYAYSLEVLRERAKSLYDTLVRANVVSRVHYAIKANSHPVILQTVAEEGLQLECVSIGEVQHARDTVAGMKEQPKILFTPNFCAIDDFERAFSLGCDVTVDNDQVLVDSPTTFQGRPIILRIDPGAGDGHHAKVVTAGGDAKFGIALEDVARALVAVKSCGAILRGFHIHVGSGIHNPATWERNAVMLLELTRKHELVTGKSGLVFNCGGGLGIPVHEGDSSLDLAAVAAGLSSFKAAHPGVELWMEPGRFLVAECGVLLASVTQLKTKRGARFVGLDAGMSTLLRPALYDAHHPVVNLSALERDEVATPPVCAHVVGPVCESADVFGRGMGIPASTQRGDVVAVCNAGAYGASMSSRYNMLRQAREVFV